MPLYDYECATCGLMELHHSMSETVKRCPQCKGRKIAKAFITVPAGKIYGSQWENENGGRGRFIDYVARPLPDGRGYDTKDPNAYCRSPQDAIEKGKRMGLKLKKD